MQNNVRKIRQMLGVKIRIFSTESGLSPSYIYYVETGQKTPSVLVALKMARALGVTVEELFNLDDEEAATTDDPTHCIVA